MVGFHFVFSQCLCSLVWWGFYSVARGPRACSFWWMLAAKTALFPIQKLACHTHEHFPTLHAATLQMMQPLLEMHQGPGGSRWRLELLEAVSSALHSSKKLWSDHRVWGMSQNQDKQCSSWKTDIFHLEDSEKVFMRF